MKSPMSGYIRSLISKGNAATKIVDAILEERSIPGNQAIRIKFGNKITLYKSIGQISRNHKREVAE